MPIRDDPKRGGRTALCINCPDTMLTMPNCRFTLQPDEDFGNPQTLPLFAAVCTKCGYTELYQDGYLFSSSTTPASTK
ncbi:hypothetical protein JY651_16550 [Pyxidicoccus parkwayensis]|uniref:Uncharacterized protein n=1 Tax=Pyxidicoccus parkwayensis TaxID=2813578 RepID=A0ABX7P7J9_9BACT|nr:hypothetical protein [Pyxidicoccus parkwaysis]QSQ26437.1 hypothetical protein JY651_16550 [Pyxidicoccus parkwaysis]